MSDRLDVKALVTASLSDVGKRRSENQDSCGDFLHLAGERLLILADGMGGHSGGQVASRDCVEAFANVFEQQAGSPEEQLRAAFELANDRIYQRSCNEEHLRGMGTTGVALLFSADGTVLLGWVGDSRAYRWRAGVLEQLTTDHALVAEWVSKGVLSAKEAETHPRRSELTRAIGIRPEVEPEFRVLDLGPADRYLLCSDGLSGLVHDEQIGQVLGGEDPDRAVQTLVQRANALGGTDNVSVQIACVPDVLPSTCPSSGAPEDAADREIPEQPAEEADRATPGPPALGVESKQRREPEQLHAREEPAPEPVVPRVLYVSDMRRLHAPSALLGAGVAALCLTLGHYAFTQLSRDLHRLGGEYEVEAEPSLIPYAELPESPITLASQGAAYAVPAPPDAPTVAYEEPAPAPVLAEAMLQKPAPRAESHPASPQLPEAALVVGELPSTEGLALEPDVRRFLDEWLRALATRDFGIYQSLGFPESPREFVRRHAGHESFRLEDATTEPLRARSEKIYLRAVLSYVFEDETGRWRTEDEHRLVLRETEEGLRFDARWK